MTHRAENLYSILPQKKDGVISSVVILPENITFETQNPGEKVYLLLRRHITTNLGWIISFIGAMVLPIFIFVLAILTNFNIKQIIHIKTSYLLVVISLWYLLNLTGALMKFLDWYYNVYLITNERVIDFDFNPFAYHKISETSLENIVDATQETIGFLPMLFDFGDVYVQTAGTKQEFDFTAVSKPGWVRDKIMDLRDLAIKSPK